MRLRIIAGSLGGRFIDTPGGAQTHPMSERARSALFNSLGDITDYEVLDVFAGSGALSFESVSRGAKHATAIERDRKAQITIAKNIETLAVAEKVKLIRASALSWSKINEGRRFDVIFCDPPYDKLQLSTVSALSKHLKPNGLMVLSYPGRESTPTVNGVVVVDTLGHGDAALAIYRKGAA